MATPTPDPSSLAERALRRQNPREEPSALTRTLGSVRGALGNGRPYRDPPASALRGLASNRPDAALAEDRRGERSGKRRGVDRVRWGSGRRSRSARPLLWVGCALLRRRKGLDGIKNGGPASSSETSLAGSRVPGQVVPGVEAA